MIDFNQAPEGATHYANDADNGTSWFRLCPISLCYFHHSAGWTVTHVAPRYALANIKQIPPKWVEGELPPVGTVCEVRYGGSWAQCEVFALKQTMYGVAALFTVGITGWDSWAYPKYFRPIETPEQKAAKERGALELRVATLFCRDGAFDLDDPEVMASVRTLLDKGMRFKEDL